MPYVDPYSRMLEEAIAAKHEREAEKSRGSDLEVEKDCEPPDEPKLTQAQADARRTQQVRALDASLEYSPLESAFFDLTQELVQLSMTLSNMETKLAPHLTKGYLSSRQKPCENDTESDEGMPLEVSWTEQQIRNLQKHVQGISAHALGLSDNVVN